MPDQKDRPQPASTTLDRNPAEETRQVVTLGYVYDRPGFPPLPIGSRLSMSRHEAAHLRSLGLVRLETDQPMLVETAGPAPDRDAVLAPPPPAPAIQPPAQPAK